MNTSGVGIAISAGAAAAPFLAANAGAAHHLAVFTMPSNSFYSEASIFWSVSIWAGESDL
jgi:hypothetical protein